jgi:hypothetical protein
MKPHPLASRTLLWLIACLVPACTTGPVATDQLPERRTATPQVVVSVFTRVPTVTLIPTLSISPTPIYELGTGQHIAADGSFQALETDAAGPMTCRIERGSPAFLQFIGVFDPRLLWSAGEAPPYDDEDHRMHPAMFKPLVALVDLVEAEWNGETQIMITEAYDSLLDHNLAQPDAAQKYSLHFEGRSIDMIPWPPDTARLSRTCALAHTAGFDWVHNEQDHCHASVNAESLCNLYDYRAP